MLLNRNELKKIVNKLKKEILSLKDINEDAVCDLLDNKGYDYDGCEENYWIVELKHNDEEIIFDGRVTKKNLGFDDDVMRYYEGHEIKEGVYLSIAIEDGKVEMECYVNVYTWFEYPVYNETQYVELFTVKF